jgi:SAM-dependent methyltransferase
MITVEFRRLNIAAGERILDVGCGSGRHMAEAYRLPRVKVSGVDRSARDLAQARERLELHYGWGQHGGGSWNLTVADITRLPFADHQFDVVVCSEVLEHITDYNRAVREVLRVLRPAGRLVVSVPRYWPEKVCWFLSKAYCAEAGGHIRIFRRRELVACIQSAGSRFMAHHYAHGLHAPFWWLKCLLGLENEGHPLVRLYHRFLVWDMLSQPSLTRTLERLIDPLMGKSEVFYFLKNRF